MPSYSRVSWRPPATPRRVIHYNPADFPQPAHLARDARRRARAWWTAAFGIGAAIFAVAVFVGQLIRAFVS